MKSCLLFIVWFGFRGNWNIFYWIVFYRYFLVIWRFGYFFFWYFYVFSREDKGIKGDWN